MPHEMLNMGWLPVLCFFSLGGVLYLYWLREGSDCPVREAFVTAAVFWAGYAVLSAELLGRFKLLGFYGLCAAWGLFFGSCLAAAGMLLRKPGLGAAESHARLPMAAVERLFLIAGYGTVALIIAVVGAVAWTAPPNTWDVLTYHLGRVMHWIQNRGFGFYPTEDPRQLVYPPGAEILLAHFQILSGGDRLANLPQWAAMTLSVLASTCVARELGAGRLGQMMAAVCTATIPIGILQASSAKNDYVGALWVITAAAEILREPRRPHWARRLCVFAAFGLAVLTKASSAIFALPFLLVYLRGCVGRFRRQSWKMIAMLFLVAGLLNLGYAVRLSAILQHVRTQADIASIPELHIEKGRYLVALGSNVIRNLAANLSTPFTMLNQDIEAGVIALHRLLGWDPQDPATTYEPSGLGIGWGTSELGTGNPLHVLLFAGALGAVFLKRRQEDDKARTYGLAAVSAFLLFCLSSKWSVWHTRTLLPLLVLGSALTGYWAGAWRRLLATGSVMTMFFIGSVPFVFFNDARPVLGAGSVFFSSRGEMLFRCLPDLRQSYERVTSMLIEDFIPRHGVRKIGLVMSSDQWEYPLWVLLKRAGTDGLRIEQAEVRNFSRDFADPSFVPQAYFFTRDQTELFLEYLSRYGQDRAFFSLYSPYAGIFLVDAKPDHPGCILYDT